MSDDEERSVSGLRGQPITFRQYFDYLDRTGNQKELSPLPKPPVYILSVLEADQSKNDFTTGLKCFGDADDSNSDRKDDLKE